MNTLKVSFIYQNSLFFLIILTAFILRIWNLGYPDNYYFDEVYHAFTAQAYADNDPRGYEWWNQAPEGLAYEWLHPPLAKLIQAFSIVLFGDTPFFWRLPSVVFGLGTGILLYFIGRDVFKSKTLGLLAMTFWSFDGLALTLSRITMNDIFLAFFVTLAFYLFMVKKELLLVGLVLGLAVSTKWPGLFAIGFIGFLWFAQSLRNRSFIRELPVALGSFFIIPICIYILSYSQFFLQGHTIDQFKELHRQIWWYQTNLEADHPYGSTPFDWAFLRRPLYAFTEGKGTSVANIYFLGNPVFHWGGLVAVIYGAVYLLQERTKSKLQKENLALFSVILGYAAMFLPWTISPRIMFVYHYVPALPFMFLALAWLMNQFWKDNGKVVTIAFVGLGLVVFTFFYPHWVGIMVPGNIDKMYYWIPSWR